MLLFDKDNYYLLLCLIPTTHTKGMINGPTYRDCIELNFKRGKNIIIFRITKFE